MNVLLLTLIEFDSLHERSIYTDLLREFVKNGHQVYAISPVEKRKNVETHLIEEENATILRLQIGNTQKTNIIEKGISTLLIEPIFKKAIKTFFAKVKFDLVLYSTPPITLVSSIEYVKKRDNARTYLLLKDIFPQNAVDIGMMRKTGIKGLLYRYFRNKEKKLYAVSDRIGCMSEANVRYVVEHNPKEDPSKFEVCPNSIEIQDMTLTDDQKQEMREKYSIPFEKKVFVYGGNLGKPQGIPFIIDCLRRAMNNQNAFFLIVGDGTEYEKMESFISEDKPQNVRLMKRLPKEDYDRMVAACDVGMIFLDHRFTIPNFPSRLLSYMQAGLPVLACTDPNTDIGQVAQDGGFGWWCESNDVSAFVQRVDEICRDDLADKGAQAMEYLKKEYSIEDSYQKVAGLLK